MFKKKINKDQQFIDDLFTKLLEEGALINRDSFLMEIEYKNVLYKIWCENRPYADCQIYTIDGRSVERKNIIYPSETIKKRIRELFDQNQVMQGYVCDIKRKTNIITS